MSTPDDNVMDQDDLETTNIGDLSDDQLPDLVTDGGEFIDEGGQG